MRPFIRQFSAAVFAALVCFPGDLSFCRTGNFPGDKNYSPDKTTAAPSLYFEEITEPVIPGTVLTLRVVIGTDVEPIADLFGLSFELAYSDDSFLEFVQPTEATAGPFLQPDTYTFTRHDPENKILYLAVSRKRGAPGQDGSGVVLQISVKIKEEAPPGWQTCFAIRNSSANDSIGTTIPILNGDLMCITVAEPALVVIPNPFTPNGDGANDTVEFRRDGGFPVDWEVVIMDRAGRQIKRLSGGQNIWDGKDEQNRTMLPGTYLYVVRSATQIMKRGLLWLIL